MDLMTEKMLALLKLWSSEEGREQEWLTTEEACKRMKVSRWTLARLRKNGCILAKKLTSGKSSPVRYSALSINAFMADLSDPLCNTTAVNA